MTVTSAFLTALVDNAGNGESKALLSTKPLADRFRRKPSTITCPRKQVSEKIRRPGPGNRIQRGSNRLTTRRSFLEPKI